MKIDKKQVKVDVGFPAPNFKEIGIDGKPIDLMDFKGKYVLLDFWASWCKPCIQATPKLKKILENHKELDVEVIGFSFDRDSIKWKQAIKREGLSQFNHVMLGLKNNSVGETYHVETIPSYILIDKSSKLLGIFAQGKNEDFLEDLDQKLDTLLNL